MIEPITYKECLECRMKPGSPELCHQCLINRSVIFTLNEVSDTLNKLTKDGVDIKLCPIHNNTHYCKYKIGASCECKCTCDDERLNELAESIVNLYGILIKNRIII